MKKGVLELMTVLLVCSCGQKKESGVKAPTRVKTEVVSSASDMAGQTFVGIVEESEGTAVSFTGMGVVKRMLVNEGKAVSRGQLIAEMDDTQARNLLNGAEAQMNQANDALERYKLLHDNGSLPEVQCFEESFSRTTAGLQQHAPRRSLKRLQELCSRLAILSFCYPSSLLS